MGRNKPLKKQIDISSSCQVHNHHHAFYHTFRIQYHSLANFDILSALLHFINHGDVTLYEMH